MIIKKKSSITKVALLLCLCLGLFAVPVFAQDFMGTEGNDTINGTAANDTIQGRGGNDTLSGLAGNDTIFGDDGMDYIFGGDGNDTLAGGNEDDLLMGEAGDDTYFVDDTTRYGYDRIVEGAQNSSENNRIILDYNSSDVAFIRNPFFTNDLMILFRYKSAMVMVEGFFSQQYIKTVQCNDVTYTYQQIANMVN